MNELAPRLRPYAGALAQWFATQSAVLVVNLIHFVSTTAIAAIMYSRGETGAAMAIAGLAGDLVAIAARWPFAWRATPFVALPLGVVVTAAAQTALSGIRPAGRWHAVCGLPGPRRPLCSASYRTSARPRSGADRYLDVLRWRYAVGNSPFAVRNCRRNDGRLSAPDPYPQGRLTCHIAA